MARLILLATLFALAVERGAAATVRFHQAPYCGTGLAWYDVNVPDYDKCYYLGDGRSSANSLYYNGLGAGEVLSGFSSGSSNKCQTERITMTHWTSSCGQSSEANVRGVVIWSPQAPCQPHLCKRQSRIESREVDPEKCVVATNVTMGYRHPSGLEYTFLLPETRDATLEALNKLITADGFEPLPDDSSYYQHEE